jgi:peptidyl-prolyl cis-trans isomerase D
MLKGLRENSKNLVMTIFFVIIILVFVFGAFNPGSGASCAGVGGENYPATILGRRISKEEFQENLGSIRQMLYSPGPSALGMLSQNAAYLTMFSPALAPQSTLDLMISREILGAAAKEMGFAVSDDEIDAEILDPKLPGRTPFVDKDGKFDNERFEEYVSYQVRTSMREYREDLRRQLLAQKMADFLASQVKVSDEELKLAYQRGETKVDIEFVKIFVAPYRDKAGEVTDEEAKAYADSHKDEVKKHFEEHEAEYGPTIHARHILIKAPKVRLDESGQPTDPKAAGEDKKAKAKIDALYTQLEGGAEFEQLAKDNSEDASNAPKGGDLDWFGKDRMVPEFTEVAFATEPGKYSKPFRTQYGWHIVKVDEKKEGKTVEEATPEIAKKLAKDEKAKTAAKEAAEKLLAEAKALDAKDSLEKLVPAKKAEGPAGETPASAPASGPASASAPAFDIDDLPVEKEDPYALKVVPTGLFSLAQTDISAQVPQIGKSSELVSAAFALTKEKPLPAGVFEVGDAFVVIKLKDRADPDMEKFKEQRDSLREEALRGKQFQFLTSWIAERRQAAEEAQEIYYDPGLLAKSPDF